jgi:hypothetical protein
MGRAAAARGALEVREQATMVGRRAEAVQMPTIRREAKLTTIAAVVCPHQDWYAASGACSITNGPTWRSMQINAVTASC